MKLTLSKLLGETIGADAEPTLLQAHDAAPGELEPLLSLGLLEGERGRADQALEYFRRALALDPICAEVHVAAAEVLLRHGRWKRGWEEYEWRLRLGDHAAKEVRKPVWKGQPLDGAHLLIQRERTVSEQLLFMRYLRFLKDLGASVALEVPPELARLARRFPDVASVIASSSELPAATKTTAWRCSIGSLPFRLGSAASGASRPYLPPDPARARHWKDRLDRMGAGGRRVGISWSSSAPDVRRLSASDVAPLSAVRGVAWIGLSDSRNGKPAIPMLDLSSELHDLADAADLIATLDLVITDDNPLADVAGALGKEVWVLLPGVSDWRWGTADATTPWYPSARLFRQSTLGQWGDVMTRVTAAL